MSSTGENLSELAGLIAALLYFLIPLGAMRLAESGSGRLGRSIFICWCVFTLGGPLLVAVASAAQSGEKSHATVPGIITGIIFLVCFFAYLIHETDKDDPQ